MSRDDGGAVGIRVLTCADSQARRIASARRQLVGIAGSHPVHLVNGFVPTDAGLDRLYDASANRRAMNRPLAPREVAVYATHRLAWKAIRDGAAPVGVVLEDDFTIADAPAFRAVLTRSVGLGGGSDVVKLFDLPKAGANPIVAIREVGPVRLVRWRYPTAGAVAYLLTRRGAARLLARDRIFRPIDEDMKYFWELGLDVWSVLPSPVGEASAVLGGSLIDRERKAAKSRSVIDRVRGNLIRLHWRLNCRLRHAGADLTDRCDAPV